MLGSISSNFNLTDYICLNEKNREWKQVAFSLYLSKISFSLSFLLLLLYIEEYPLVSCDKYERENIHLFNNLREQMFW